MTYTYITTVEAAKLMRAALKEAFPNTKFSVRKGTGTASAWIDVRWTDGPVNADVDAIVDRFDKSNKYVVAGVLTQRSFSDEAYRHLYAQIASNNRTVAVLDAEGNPNKNLNPDFVADLYVADLIISGARGIREAAYQMAHQINNPTEFAYS